MAYTTISKHTDYFNTVTWTGTGYTNNITGVGHQPDMTWIKKRNGTTWHNLYDAVRGVTKAIIPNETDAEGTRATGLTAFGSDGFTVGADNNANANGDTYVGWNWKAGTTSGINTTGADITPSSYSMSSTAGISIIKFTGNGTDGAKIAHGLGAVPEMIISKRLENANYWAVYHKMDNTDYLVLDTNAAYSDAPIWKDTTPTSVYYQTDNSNSVNPSSETVVAYCFKSVPGFSKIGAYTGNGSSSTPMFVYTGFKPKFVMVKNTSQTDDWFIHDDKRDGYNDDNEYLFASIPNAEGTNTNRIRFLSNGFSVPTTDKSHNVNGNVYAYMAFGQSLVGSNNVPCTAR
jgi:hypothetical protein